MGVIRAIRRGARSAVLSIGGLLLNLAALGLSVLRGQPAGVALLSAAAWERAERLREGARYIELSSRADFQELFVDKMML